MLELFISYSHANESKIEDFIKYMSPLTSGDDPLLNIWYDREIKAGDDFWGKIDEHLANRDVICLFLSKDYLASGSCRKEMENAIERHKTHGVLVVPVILSTCRWLDANSDLSRLLAATTDAKPIDSYTTEDEGWDDVYEHIQRATLAYSLTKSLRVSDEFQEFLNDATLLTKAHSEKNKILLDDIYVGQELTGIDQNNNESKTSVEKILATFNIGSKYNISGDDQSGKSSILKKAFVTLRERGFIPVYLKGTQHLYQGKLSNKVKDEFAYDYATDKSLDDYDTKRVVVLIDDFHKIKRKEKVLKELNAEYQSCILMVDDIFCLDVANEGLVVDFNRYRIRELKASLRNKLIKNWLSIREDSENRNFGNDELARIDEMTDLVEQSLGKMLGSGIMPAHPFFILYVLSTYDFNVQPGNEPNITSQGHCYQALIYFLLVSHDVRNGFIDAYLNFFTEFSKTIYFNKGNPLNPEEFEDFTNTYSERFNYVEDKSEFLQKAYNSGIISCSSLGTYSFGYPYLYYYFAGKYFSDQWNETDSPSHVDAVREVHTILENLHKTSNAYIAIFIAHHTKNASFLNTIIETANSIYSNYEPATLTPETLNVFGKQTLTMCLPSLPAESSVAKNRQKVLEEQDKIEENRKKETDDEDEVEDDFSKELRRSIKTVEVVGAIIKNRAGSLDIDKLKYMFAAGMYVHLRHLTCFLKLIEKITEAADYSDFLIDRIKGRFPEKSNEQLKEIANKLFWTMNHGVIYGLIRKIAKSLGSSKLTKIVLSVCNQLDTPATFMIKHTILMWNNKNLRIDELQDINKTLKSPITKNIMLWLVVDYCSMHRIDYKDRAKLISLGIKPAKLLPMLRDDK